MAATNVLFDFADVVITPSGGSAITLSETIQIRVIHSDTLDTWQSAGHRFPTVVVNSVSNRGVNLSGGDINKHLAIPSGVACTITGKILDAKNGAGEGSIVLSLVNAIKSDGSFGGGARKFAEGGVEFMAFSTDGTTDPMTLTVTPASP